MEKGKRGLTGDAGGHWPSSRPASHSKSHNDNSSGVLDLLRTSQPIQFIILSAIFVIGYVYWPEAPHALSPAARAVLSSNEWHDPAFDRVHARLRSCNKGKAVDNYGNPYGLSGRIDALQEKSFNPSVLVLPDAVGEQHRRLLVNRGKQPMEVIEGFDIFWSYVFASFVVEDTREKMGLPYLRREGEQFTLDLPAVTKVEYPRCHVSLYSHFIGGEDPRLFFTNDGQPLMIYSQTGDRENVCRAMAVIDVRSVVPGLREILENAGWNAPTVFKEQTLLLREGQDNVEKNWSPFLGENDELFFHVNLVPQEIYKYVPNQELKLLVPNPPAINCLSELSGAERDHAKFHHATPLLRATLCRRGECVPDIHNTVLFAIVHIKVTQPLMFYERRVVTWNVTAPYEYVSVSKPIQFTGTNQMDYVFTVSMAWDHPQTKGGLGLNHGFLDEVLVTSYGVHDDSSGYTEALARDLLTDHQMCDGTRQASGLW